MVRIEIHTNLDNKEQITIDLYDMLRTLHLTTTIDSSDELIEAISELCMQREELLNEANKEANKREED